MSRQPYSVRMRDLDDLLGVNRRGLTDEQRAVNAANYEALQRACERAKVRRPDAVSVLRVLVDTTHPATGLTDQAVTQLATKCDLGSDTVKRALTALTQAGLLETVKRGGGPRGAGAERSQPTVRRATFLTEVSDQPPVDSGLTRRTEVPNSAHQRANSAHSGAPPYALPTPTPLPVRASNETRGATGNSMGGIGEAQQGNDPWAAELIDNLAHAIYSHEAEQGQAAKVVNPAAVIRTRKRPLAEAWVTDQLLKRSDSDTLRHLAPDDPDLLAWGVSEVRQENTYGAASTACVRARDLEAACREPCCMRGSKAV